MLALLAITTSPVLSQPQAAANTMSAPVAGPTSVSDAISWACDESNDLIAAQLGEIAHLQAREIAVTHDLAGYFYAIVKGRKLLGCPNVNPLSVHSQQNSTTATPDKSKRGSGNGSSEKAQIIETLCKPALQLREDVMDQIGALQEYKMPIPDFLAGWYSLTEDANKYWNCGFQGIDIGAVDSSGGD